MKKMTTEKETKKRIVCKYCGEEITNEYGSGVDGFPGGWSIVLEGKWLSPWCPDTPEGKKQHEPMEDGQAVSKAESITESITESKPEEAYFDRNQAAMALARCAQMLGYKVGISPNDEWPILRIELPTGQVSWHLPARELVGNFPAFDGEWDGHDVEEKRERLRKFIMGE